MSRRPTTLQAYMFVRDSFREERRRWLQDTRENALDLYEPLSEKKDASLRTVGFERYQLLSFMRQWEQTTAQAKTLPETEYYNTMNLFVPCFRQYLQDLKGTSTDMPFIEAELQSLELLLEKNVTWQDKVGKTRVQFLRSRNLLESLIKDMKKRGMQ
ncbi:MAG: hypothetical protein Q4F00_06220 [bacterium]|nr:hypothetical protein [bacterium]